MLRSRDVQLRSGEKVQKIEVVAENILLLDGKKNNNKKDVSNYYAVGDDIELPDFLNDLEKI